MISTRATGGEIEAAVNETTILDLPDECLIEIFNYIIDFDDLISVHEACEHFQRAAEYQFWREIKHITILYNSNNIFYMRVNGRNGENRNRAAVFNVFKRFGSCITSLGLSVKSAEAQRDIQTVLAMVQTYCGVRLKSLCLQNVCITDLNLRDFRHLLRNLEKLELISFSEYIFPNESQTDGSIIVSRLEECINYCENLKELSIDGDSEYSLPRRMHSKVEKFTICLWHEGIKRATVREFFKNHQDLKAIRVHYFPNALLDCLEYMNNVDSLYVDVMPTSVSNKIDWIRLFHLPNLKRLELYLNEITYRSLVKKVTTKPITNIETLELRISFNGMDMAYGLLTIFTYKNLKRLVIGGNEGDRPRPELNMSKNFDQLEGLCFLSTSIDVLIDFVRRANSLKVLCVPWCKISYGDLIRLAKIQQVKGMELQIFCGNSYGIIQSLSLDLPTKRKQTDLKNLKFKYLDDSQLESYCRDYYGIIF